MGNMGKWAEKEVELVCKEEKTDLTEMEKLSFDYGCSCYSSALKAYNSLCEDGHSGYSFRVTKDILIRLMEGKPLTPITEKDFDGVKPSSLDGTTQCPRMGSLFRITDENGNFKYDDIDRVYCININKKEISYLFTKASDIVNKLYPIKLPYMPANTAYRIYMEEFTTDKGFYILKYLYMITPDYDRIELNMFEAYLNEKWVNITKDQYEEWKKNVI